MYSLQVKGSLPFSGQEIPIIEGGFGEQERIILAKTIAEFHNISIDEVNRLINNNLDKFKENVDFINICDLIINDKELIEKLGLKLTDVTKYFYILPIGGCIKLVNVINFSNDTKSDKVKNFIDSYFNINHLKLLSRDAVNDILKLANQNINIQDYIKILVPPYGKKGKEFKESEINKFIGKINCDIEKYLINQLEVPDLEHIPTSAHKVSGDLVKKFYTLPESLEKEFFVLLNKLLDKRLEVIKDNQSKNAKLFQEFKDELETTKFDIFLFNVYHSNM